MSSCDIEILVAHLPPPLSCTSNFALVRASLLATSMFLGGKVLLEGKELTREYSVAWKWSVSPRLRCRYFIFAYFSIGG